MQLLSSIPLEKFYCLKSISDLIITKKTASTSAAENPVYVVEELVADFIEIKHGSRFHVQGQTTSLKPMCR